MQHSWAALERGIDPKITEEELSIFKKGNCSSVVCFQRWKVKVPLMKPDTVMIGFSTCYSFYSHGKHCVEVHPQPKVSYYQYTDLHMHTIPVFEEKSWFLLIRDTCCYRLLSVTQQSPSAPSSCVAGGEKRPSEPSSHVTRDFITSEC